jgi:hypothetical protein
MDVASFVDPVLRSSGRSLPVVLVSPVGWDDNPLVDAGELQDKLAGLALVAELKTKWAAFELSNAVGPMYSCYNGALRIYWPGFKGGPDDPQEHYLYLPAQLQKLQGKNSSVARLLFRHFSAVAAFRYTDGEVTTRARQAIDQDRRAQFEALIEQSRANPSKSVDAQVLEFALSENDRLEKETKQQKERLAELERDLAMAMAQFQQPALPGETDAADAPAEAPIETVAAALRVVAERNTKSLVVLKSAYEAAEKSDFSRPEDVLKGLLAIVEIGESYFTSKGKKSVGPLEELFQQKGLKYAPTESQNTLNMYGDERKFLKDGVRKQMLKHITIGKGDTKNCLQIYFDFNDETKQIEIGHCGRHLPYYGQKT